jgi:glycosyltransferase involved in cell wall biosynthesis
MRIGVDASRCFVERKTGVERYAYEILRHILMLPESGKHEWMVYVKSGQGKDFFGGDNVRVVEIPGKYLWTQIGLATRTWTDKLDVLWVPAHTLPIMTNPAVKTVVTVHGLEYEWLPSFDGWFNKWYLPFSTKFVARRAGKLIAVSEFTQLELVRRLGVAAEKIKVIQEGVAANLKSRAQATAIKSVMVKYGLREGHYVITVGTIQPRKNIRRLIAAFARLKAQDPRLKLVIVGKMGWDYAGDVAAPREFGVADKVRFLDYVSDAEKDILLGNAVMYVQASITEGFGLPVIEAMQAGVAVVSSNGGALKEVVGEAGMVFDPLDVEQMAEVMSRVVADIGLRTKLVRLGRARAKKFTWKKAAKSTYNWLCD